MMRGFLLFLGWTCALGSVGDTVIAAYAAIIVGVGGWTEPGLSVEALFRDHIPWLYWAKQVAYYVMPGEMVAAIFAIPALVLFPIRVIVSGLIGKWAFAKARRLQPA